MRELFPAIQPQLVERDDTMPLYREAAWDFVNGRPIWRNGSPVWVTGDEGIKVWAWKALMTARARYEIYSWNFGSDVETLMGQNYSSDLKRAEAVRYVREALEINPYIHRISDIDVDFDRGKLTISATLYTIYGEVIVNV